MKLLGVSFTAGCTSSELNEALQLLRSPTPFTAPILRMFKSVMKQDGTVAKAHPPCFFSFGGQTSGLYLIYGTFPFTREYQIFTWFRVDKFENTFCSSGERAQLDHPPMSTLKRQYIVSVMMHHRMVLRYIWNIISYQYL